MFKKRLSQNEQRHYIRDLFVFFVLAVLPVIVSFIRKLEISDDLPYIKQVDEFVLLIMVLFIIKGFKQLNRYKYGILFVFFFISYIVNSAIFAVIHSVDIKVAAFQGILDLKFLLVFTLVIGLPNKLLLIQRFIQLGKFVMLISLPFIFLQFFSLDYYNILFPNGGHLGVFKLLDDSDLERGTGVFWFVGELASFTSFFVCYFFFEFIDKRKSITGFWLLFSSIILLLTLSRLEIVATLLACLYVYTFAHKSISKKILLLIVSTSIVLIGVLLVYPLLESAFERLGLYSPELSTSARVVFYYSSYILTLENFPFGTGLGTFGGQSSVIFGSSIYDDLHFKQYSWYQQSITMTDVFWPHVLVEGGVIGLTLYFSAIFSLFKWAKLTLKEHVDAGTEKVLSQVALAAFLVMIINSMASANMNDSYMLFTALLVLSFVVTEQQKLKGS